MWRIILIQAACSLFVFIATAFANPDSVVVPGDLRIIGSGNGLVFPDGSIQYQATVVGPQGPAGTSGYNSLINLIDEAAGANCANGGVKIQAGLDLSRNGVLEASEVSQTKYTCNGGNTVASLIGNWFHRATSDSSNQILTLTSTTWQNNDAGNGGCIESGTYSYNNTTITFTYGSNGGCHGEAPNSSFMVRYNVSATNLILLELNGDLAVDYIKL